MAWQFLLRLCVSESWFSVKCVRPSKKSLGTIPLKGFNYHGTPANACWEWTVKKLSKVGPSPGSGFLRSLKRMLTPWCDLSRSWALLSNIFHLRRISANIWYDPRPADPISSPKVSSGRLDDKFPGTLFTETYFSPLALQHVQSQWLFLIPLSWQTSTLSMFIQWNLFCGIEMRKVRQGDS